MRALILAFLGDIALESSTQAAPFALDAAAIELASAQPLEPAAQDCGWGWHRTHWRDQWGNWHWGPDKGPHGAWSEGAYYSYPGWRVAPHGGVGVSVAAKMIGAEPPTVDKGQSAGGS